MTDQLKVGDREVQLPALNGFKAVRAGRLVSEAAECLPAVQEALAQLRERSVLTVTPEMAKLPRFHREIDGQEVPIFSEADFASQPDGVIRIPQEPTRQDVILAVFPIAFKHAEKQLVELLGLVTIPNDQLREADAAGTVDTVIEQHGKDLLHEATIAQLLALTTAAVQQVAEAIQGDELGEALGAVTGRAAPTPQSVEDRPATQPSIPESPTASPAPTGGPEPIASTEHPGENSGSY